MIIQPIDLLQQDKVIAEVQRYIEMASSLYKKRFNTIDVVFNLRGRAAGIYRVYFKRDWLKTKQQQIRFNPWLFAKYPEDSWQNTIPHEVAHYIADCLYGLDKIKPHGKEWQAVMLDFGAEPTVRADYDLSGIPVRQTRRYQYQCACRQVELSHYRHKKIQQGLQVYQCRDCYQPLSLVDVG
ncbi:MAG: SprT-like domain-containing protein [Pseudomonadota bacterium]